MTLPELSIRRPVLTIAVGLLKLSEGREDLRSQFDAPGRRRAAQRQRHPRLAAGVGRDLVALEPVAAGDRTHEPATVVDEGKRQAVILWLHDARWRLAAGGLP